MARVKVPVEDATGLRRKAGWKRATKRKGQLTNLLQVGLHDLGTIVHSQDNVGDTSISQSLNLMLDHGLVGKLDQRLGKSKSLCTTLQSV